MSKKKFIILTISLVLILFPNKVMAKNIGPNACLKGLNITWKDGNGNTISDPTEAATNKVKVEITASEGEWQVYFGSPDIDGSDELFNDEGKDKGKFLKGFESFSSSNTYEKTVNLKDDSKAYVALFIKLKKEMKVNDGKVTCKAGNYVLNSKRIDITNDGTGSWKTYRVSKYDADLADGINASKPACDKMRNGRYKRNGQSSSNDICYNETTKTTADNCSDLSDYQSKMKDYFPYCWSGTDNANLEFDGKFINEVKQKFIKYYNLVKSINFSSQAEINAYNARLTALASSSDWTKKSVSGKKESDWVTKAGNDGKLSCTTSLASEKTDNYYAEKKVLDNSYCSVKCTEEFTTTYTPPVATKAGLCFTYQVTVKSKVNCITEQKSSIEWPKVNVKGCTFKAVCDDQSDQAGPNEEFDSCIDSCDGGKYSQSCINKCYKKVYETKKSSSNTNNTKLSNFTSDSAKVKLLANDTDPYIHYTDDDGKNHNLKDLCSTWSKLQTNLQVCAEGFREAKDSDPLGSYKYKKGKYTWIPSADVKKASDQYQVHYVGGSRSGTHSVVNSIKRAAPYYLRSVESTKVLLQSLFGYGHYYGRTYNIDNNGIKRQASGRYKCHENCWFKKKSENGCVSTVKEAKKEYDAKIDAKSSQIEACSTTAAKLCSTEEAKFTIGADNVTKKNENKGKDFSNDNKSGNDNDSITCATKSQSNLLNDIFAKLPEDSVSNPKCDNGVNGKCYGTPYNDHEYKTTITFPGAWINLKTGEVEYTNQSKKDKGFDLENYKYCTMYNSKNTNQSWWNWRVNTNMSTNAPSVDKYNIHASVEKFGKFNWKLNFKCFYAVSDSTGKPGCDPNTEVCDTHNDDDCDPEKQSCETKTSPHNIDIRFVREDKKLFAGRTYGSTGSSRDSGNQIGFNWTSDAQDKTLNSATAKGYDINPYEYGKSIMDTNNTQNVYNDEADVIITLTPDKSARIKQLLKTNSSSKQYGIGQFDKNGTWTKDKDIPMLNVYKSNILSSLGSDIVQIKYRTGYNYAKK